MSEPAGIVVGDVPGAENLPPVNLPVFDGEAEFTPFTEDAGFVPLDTAEDGDEFIPFTEDAGFIPISPMDSAVRAAQAVDESVGEFGRAANVGISEAFGAPVDLMNFALNFLKEEGQEVEEPFGGSKSIQRAL